MIERERRRKECEISFRNRVPEKVDLHTLKKFETFFFFFFNVFLTEPSERERERHTHTDLDARCRER